MPWKKAGRELYKRPDNHTQCDLTDAEWAVLEPLVPKRGGMGRPRATDPRRVFDAVQYMPQTGCQWRMIPACYPPFTTVQHHFHAWRDSGVFGNMPDALRGMARDAGGTRGGADGGRGRQPDGENDRERRTRRL